MTPAVRLRGARLAFGDRVLWDGLDLDVAPGEFLAVLGPNGSGKTSLLRVLLGMNELTGGTAEVGGAPVRGGSTRIGYIPQQRAVDTSLALRGRDLVGLGLDGHRWGPFALRGRAGRARRIDAALASVGASGYAKAPVGLLSGGEQQRLRVAQALVGEPAVLLCDEPLLSLDLAHQRVVSSLIGERSRQTGAAVLFVTHEINPVLDQVDRVLYLVDGRFRIGPPAEVMTTETLSELYRTRVEVLRLRDRIVVVGADAETTPADCHHVREPAEELR
ncbi:metal ABC transporter ATP-binding protein [Crossiella sp. CA-258035]|uniref:metal ABC transporter ATP-binding protein n=1 Tax=Crossiella sp. CA-258035 TaxID=2981138 RepID=UPI0024BCEE86|nr:metal ABC transporter ATP-binding protein [Crossiella sp. CA-258035]WHT19885.1 metal ABC transporter ATP-binding protein [Crossiella sp. CA-258035]